MQSKLHYNALDEYLWLVLLLLGYVSNNTLLFIVKYSYLQHGYYIPINKNQLVNVPKLTPLVENACLFVCGIRDGVDWQVFRANNILYFSYCAVTSKRKLI